jgi:hypothetical protein
MVSVRASEEPQEPAGGGRGQGYERERERGALRKLDWAEVVVWRLDN